MLQIFQIYTCVVDYFIVFMRASASILCDSVHAGSALRYNELTQTNQLLGVD